MEKGSLDGLMGKCSWGLGTMGNRKDRESLLYRTKRLILNNCVILFIYDLLREKEKVTWV
jgi:hypothetical protein